MMVNCGVETTPQIDDDRWISVCLQGLGLDRGKPINGNDLYNTIFTLLYVNVAFLHLSICSGVLCVSLWFVGAMILVETHITSI